MGLLELFKRRKPSQEVVLQPPAKFQDRGFNPVADPDLARRQAFLIPGVINGTHQWETPDGLWTLDFDHRDDQGNPTRKFYPKIV